MLVLILVFIRPPEQAAKQLTNVSSSRNEMRRSGDLLYLKRDSGEVGTFTAH